MKSGRAKRRAVVAMTGALFLAASSVGLAAPASAASVLDQSSTSIGGVWFAMLDSSQYEYQTFTAGITGPLSRVELKLLRGGSPTTVVVGIRAVLNGTPSANDLTSEVVAGTSIPDSQTGNVTVNFTNPINVTSGSQYAISLHDCTGCSGSASIAWFASASNVYAGGDAIDWYQGTMSSRDFTFSTYVGLDPVSAISSAASPPDVLQHVGLPKSGSCADVDDSKLNWAGVNSGGWTPSWAQWANDGAGGEICGRTLYYAPSGRWAVRS